MTAVDPDALLCALILAPRVFPRNRYFALFQTAVAAKVRRRAARIRGIVRQLVGKGHERAEITGEQVLEDGRLLIRYQVRGMALHRTAALTPLEGASLHYALERAGVGKLDPTEKRLVESALERLGAGLELGAGVSPAADT